MTEVTERGYRSEASVRLVLAGLMLATFLAAMDSSIVSTAMPTITGILGGFGLYSWVFSIYLLTSTVTVPIFGKLADLYGRKRVLLAGVAVFIAGSALCGSAQDMTQLVIYRGIQGVGSGAILPVAITIPGDIFPPRERARVQGLIGSVWGVAAVAGPALGGLIVEHTSWRWIFYLNLPVALLAVPTIVLCYHEHLQVRKHRIDYAGALTLALGTAALLLGLTSGGRDWPWLSAQSLALFGLFVVSYSAFFRIERGVGEPVLPLGLLRNGYIAAASLASFLIGGVMTGVISYVPLFAQGVLGSSPTVAGAAVAAMSIGWTLAGTLTGRVLTSWGYRSTAILGGGLLLFGVLLLLPIGPGYGAAYVGLCSFVCGLGLGFSTTAFVVGIQNEVGWETRGSATASNLFVRSLGATIWVAALGSVINGVLARAVARHAPSGSSARSLDLINSLLDPAKASTMDGALRHAVRLGLSEGIHWAYVLEAATAVLALVAIFLLPRRGGEGFERPAPE